MRRIGIDLDGVICNFSASFWSLLNQIHSKEYPYSEPIGWTDWPPWTAVELDAGWPVLAKSDNWWLSLTPYHNNVNALRRWLVDFRSHNTDVYYITSRTPSAGWSVLKQSHNWLHCQSLLRTDTSVIVVDKPSHKSKVVRALALDAFIDDKLETVRDGHPSTRWVLLERPWNRANRDGELVVSSLEDFLKVYAQEELTK